MSFGGHVLDMQRRMRQNEELRRSRRKKETQKKPHSFGYSHTFATSSEQFSQRKEMNEVESKKWNTKEIMTIAIILLVLVFFGIYYLLI